MVLIQTGSLRDEPEATQDIIEWVALWGTGLLCYVAAWCLLLWRQLSDSCPRQWCGGGDEYDDGVVLFVKGEEDVDVEMKARKVS